jgi:hypothetical protein
MANPYHKTKIRTRLVGNTVSGYKEIVTVEEADEGYLEAKRYLAGISGRDEDFSTRQQEKEVL